MPRTPWQIFTSANEDPEVRVQLAHEALHPRRELLMAAARRAERFVLMNMPWGRTGALGMG
jgi:hypothetical protein